MKAKYIIPLLALFVALTTGCKDPVRPGFTEEANLHELSVRGSFIANKQKEYDAKIDDEKGLITVQIPYYLSDVDPVQGDLTQMQITATMPVGAKFEPQLAGVRDMQKGFKSTIYYADGTSKEYTFKAEYVKSNASDVVKIKMLGNDGSSFIYFIQPKDENGVRPISVVQLGYTHLQKLKSAKLSIETSPWSTLHFEGLDGEVDLTDESFTFSVEAQDGQSTTYRFQIIDPNYVPLGVAGSISPLFGVKVVQDDGYGWKAGANRSMAVIGEELVIANLKENFLRHNRFTGKPTGKTVDRTGIDGDVHGIAHDDAGNLIATVISSINNRWVPNHVLEVYVWKDGIEGRPTKIYSQDLQNDPMFVGKNQNANTARTIGVAGNVLQGKARLGFVFNGLNEFFVLSLVDGEVVKHSGLITPSTPIALTNASKCIPTGVEDDDPVVIGMLNDRSMVKVQMDGTSISFGPGNHWYTPAGNTKGFAYTNFNGMELVALGNGQNASWDYSIDWLNRLIVADIKSGKPSSLNTGEILDSFNLKYDPNSPEEQGDNNADYGRLYGWLNERVGTNGNKVGDACFYVNPEGSIVHVYLMVTDMGFMGWEITKFAL
ncbi:MAG: DUF5018 domain-containing protein [Porphyromonas sp.]|nr:DUF5018 domain-containing protein [Porphyromonas sp.]